MALVYGPSEKRMSSISVDPQIFNNLPSTINDILETTFTLINNARKNKTHVQKFAGLMKQIVKALSGVEYNFVLQSEFYSDLKETLSKIQWHIYSSTNRQKFVQMVMAKRDNQLYQEMQDQVDLICGRIFLAYANRMVTRKR